MSGGPGTCFCESCESSLQKEVFAEVGGPGATEMLLLLDTPCRTKDMGLVKGQPAEAQ